MERGRNTQHQAASGPLLGRFDGIVRLVSRVLAVPIAAVTMVEDDRLVVVASVGCPFHELPRSGSLPGCTLDTGRLEVVADLAANAPPAAVPVIDGKPVRFYAGMPIRGPDGGFVGTLCAADFVPRALDAEGTGLLAALAALAGDQLRLHREADALRAARTALEESERRFRDFAETASDWLWETDSDFRFTWVSDAVYGRFGFDQGWLLGKTRLDVAASEPGRRAAERLHAIMRRRESFRDLDYCGRSPNGEHWLRISGKPIFDEAGRFAGYRGTGRDVTDLKREEAARREAEERHRRLLEVCPVGLFVHRDGVITYANPAAAAILGAPSSRDLVGRAAFDLVCEPHRPVIAARSNTLLAAGGVTPPIEIVMQRLDGTPVVVETIGTAITDGGRPAVQVVLRDVTDAVRAAAALREAEERYRTLVELAPVGILVYRDGVYVLANQEAARILGAEDPAKLVGVDPFELILEPYRDRIRVRAEALLAGVGPAPPVQIEMRRFDRTTVTVETVSAAVRDAGRPAVQIVLRDVTEEHRARRALEEAETRWRALVELSPEAVLLIRDGVYVFANQRAAELFGAASPTELLGRAPSEFILDEFWPLIAERCRQLLEHGGRVPPIEIRLRRLDGRIIDVETAGAAIMGAGRPVIQSVIRDIGARKALEAELRRLAHHDPLTDLPNRLLFFDRLGRLLALAEREARRGALLLLDLDGFKAVNDAHGHDAGDALLRAVARRLQRVTRRSDTVARLAGDEFALLLYPVPDPTVVARIGERIVRALSAPVRYRGRVLRTGTSIGAALFPDDTADAETLVKNADLALYRAKASGRGGVAFVDLPMRLELEQRRSAAQALRAALERGELALRWRPRVELDSGRWPVLEAIPFWPEAPGGPNEAERLVGLAEDAGLAFELAIRTAELALETLAGWEAASMAPVRVAIDLSGAQLAIDDLRERVLIELATRGLEPRRLEVRVAERELLGRHGEAAEHALAGLRAVGLVIAIDEFGDGPMPLRLLVGGRVDAVLLAANRARAALGGGEAAPLVGSIAELGRRLGIEVGASGITSEEEAARLAALGCRYGRGPLWGAPMSDEEITAALRARLQPPCACALSTAPPVPRTAVDHRPPAG